MSIAIQRLATLRYAVLLDLETRNGGIDSRGLSEEGQRDLAYIFPRTGRLAAIRHAGDCAAAIYDSRVQERGVHHLFRLPMTFEGRIHDAMLREGCLEEHATTAPADLLKEISTEEPDPSAAKDGPLDLGTLSLVETRHLRRIAAAYADAIAGDRQVVPFFALQSA